MNSPLPGPRKTGTAPPRKAGPKRGTLAVVADVEGDVDDGFEVDWDATF